MHKKQSTTQDYVWDKDDRRQEYINILTNANYEADRMFQIRLKQIMDRCGDNLDFPQDKTTIHMFKIFYRWGMKDLHDRGVNRQCMQRKRDNQSE